MKHYIRNFGEVSMSDIHLAGGKNASLGEMFQHLTKQGIKVPDGYVVTAQAYHEFIDQNQIRQSLERLIRQLDTVAFENLAETGKQIRQLFLNGALPAAVLEDVLVGFEELKQRYGNDDIQVAVRSSATAEDLPEASFAGQQESFLNVQSEEELIDACVACYASLFSNRAIKYREDHGFDHLSVALSIGIQAMVRSDLASAGVCFTLEPETGFRDMIVINGSWGLGENVVKGSVTPDEYYVFKPNLNTGKKSVISKKLGLKEHTMVYAGNTGTSGINTRKGTENIDTPLQKRWQFALTDAEIAKLARWSLMIEEYYQRPMDIEWAKDGLTQEIFIVQARPETVHARRRESFRFYQYELKEEGRILVSGKNVGSKIVTGKARVLYHPRDIDLLKQGEILVTEITNPDWDPILKKASAIVTDKGGRTSHAAIVARELGAVAVVGTENATSVIQDGQTITVSCVQGQTGYVYDGALTWESVEIDTDKIEMPATAIQLILADPDQAYKCSFLPNDGVGLMRLEFVINNSIQIHPMALARFDTLKDEMIRQEIEALTRGYPDKKRYFIDKLSEAVATIAAAFYPKKVLVRMSDFKTNEYANLIGGEFFEPKEENPMIGWRGASRYYHEKYRAGFAMECEAMRIARQEMGLENIQLMIPFCRTVDEGRKVIQLMRDFGLKQGEDNLEVYVMTEVPSNVLQAREFSEVFDGFSIGSNDLTQLTLGIDRDSALLSDIFDATNEAVKSLVKNAIEVAQERGKKIGFCGQAASDQPAFTRFLVETGIDSISFNIDAIIKGMQTVVAAEKSIGKKIQETL